MESQKSVDYKYQERLTEGLGMKREDMPQVAFEHIPDFIVHFVEKKVGVKKVVMPLKNIKPSQEEFNEDKLLEKMQTNSEAYKTRRYLLSEDNYAIDGQHDWAHGLEMDENQAVTCFVFGLPAKSLIKRANMLKFTTSKDAKDEIVKAVE